MSNKIPVIPDSVHIGNAHIEDTQTGQSFPLNATAKTMLLMIDGKKTITMIASELNHVFPISEEQLHSDLLHLCQSLNEKHLLNFRTASPNKGAAILHYYRQQYHPRFHERTDIDAQKFMPIFTRLFVVLLKKLSLFWLLTMMMISLAAIIFQAPSLLQYGYYFSGLNIILIGSFALHEAIHMYMGRKIAGIPFGFIANDWLSIKFVRPASSQKLPRMWMATLLGPLIPGLIGVTGLIIALQITDQPHILAVSGCALFALHLLYLNPFFGDGRTLIQQFLLRRFSL